MRADPRKKGRLMKKSNISKRRFGVYWAWRCAAELKEKHKKNYQNPKKMCKIIALRP